ncbi:MAG: DUF2934 domain-containing protein [Candidatus Acidiferrales bacterium]
MADLHQDVPTRDQIQLRAYELYLKRGGQDGRDVEDWLAAETELRNHHSSSTGKFDKRDDSPHRPKTLAASSSSKNL